MSCGEWTERLSASLDGALTGEERESTERHLAACPSCRGRLQAMRAVKHAVARLPGREAPPGAVRAHIESLLLEGRAPGRRRAALWILAATLPAVAVLAVGLLRSRDHPLRADLAEELASDHLHSVPEVMPAEVVTDDAREAVRFFSGRIPFPPVAPRIDGARLLGGRLCKIEGRRVELLFYQTDPTTPDTTLSLFVSDQGLGGAGCREARGLRVCGRRAGELTLLLVGKRPPHDLRRLLEGADW